SYPTPAADAGRGAGGTVSTAGPDCLGSGAGLDDSKGAGRWWGTAVTHLPFHRPGRWFCRRRSGGGASRGLTVGDPGQTNTAGRNGRTCRRRSGFARTRRNLIHHISFHALRGMKAPTLRVEWNAERSEKHSHVERGNEPN